ncbi:hypothetical protein [Nitrobacter sp.]|uniref:hypothetical protein n=1 Tax=Nitrobacter sp. TaxID=29420 RepID=UPI0029CAC584|nr:hypothetical protein [Nitrobacter sp.]
MARSDAAGGTKSAYPPEPYDWYCEPDWAVDLLLQAEHFIGEIVDPACGRGMIPARAIAYGKPARGYDLIDRPRIADFPFEAWSFFDERHPLGRCDNIICNSPYSYQPGIAEQFIRHALTIAQHKVAMLLPSKFNSSNGRYDLFTQTPLRRIHWFCTRPSIPPGSMLTAGEIEPKGGKVDYAWFVWEIGWQGPSTNNYLILPDKLEAQRKKKTKKEAA